MILIGRLTACVSASLIIFASTIVLAAPPGIDDTAGTILAEVAGKKIQLPLLKSDYKIEVDGDMAHVELTQTFFNSTSTPLNATYLFPLNQYAAIHAMRAQLDGETVVARIERKEKAKADFDKARSEGKAAALLTQHRPNMFTQDIANLMPNRPVTITIEYAQTVPKIDGNYELVVPLIVGPRYERPIEGPGVTTSSVKAAMEGQLREAAGDRAADVSGPKVTVVSGWQIDKLPAYPAVNGLTTPEAVDPDRVGLDLSLTSSVPISRLWSDTHSLAVTGDATRKSVRFASGRTIDNRDFVLRYQLAAEKNVSVGVSSVFQAEKGGYLSLLIEPPQVPPADMIGQRELVFVLDTSGSMDGEPLDASQTFMRAAIKDLRPEDYFRILSFSNSMSEFSRAAVQASEQNKNAALSYVSGLRAGGGTELNMAMTATFDATQPENTTRIVVFLTDGYIGDERNVISTIANRIGNARIYAFGVGNSVNRFLLDAMAQEGRGYARYVPVGESAGEVAESFAAKLKTPLLTDISIDWNGLKVKDQSPAKLPDLFEGGAVRAMARYKSGGSHRIFVKGLVNGHAAKIPLDIMLQPALSDEGKKGNQALPLIWARQRIADLDRTYTIDGGRDDKLKEEITLLGLDYSLQSRFTSFVAVSEKVVNANPASARQKNVPLPQVSGVSQQAYASPNLSGSSAPEPEGILGMAVVLTALFARFRKRLVRMMRLARHRLARRLRCSRQAAPQMVDKALPRGLRRDAWWLET